MKKGLQSFEGLFTIQTRNHPHITYPINAITPPITDIFNL